MMKFCSNWLYTIPLLLQHQGTSSVMLLLMYACGERERERGDRIRTIQGVENRESLISFLVHGTHTVVLQFVLVQMLSIHNYWGSLWSWSFHIQKRQDTLTLASGPCIFGIYYSSHISNNNNYKFNSQVLRTTHLRKTNISKDLDGEIDWCIFLGTSYQQLQRGILKLRFLKITPAELYQ